MTFQPWEFNRYQIVAVLRDGGELLVSLGHSEAEARWYYAQQLEDLAWFRLSCFVLREWRSLEEGGYWRSVSMWKAKKGVFRGIAS